MSQSVLVINPWVSDFKLYDEWMHPLGLYFLLSLLRHNGVDVGFFNCLQQNSSSKSKRYATGNFEHREISKPDLYRSIKRTYKLYGQSPEALSSYLSSFGHPDAIFFGSGMTYWLPGLVETVRFVKSIFPEAPIIIGGISGRLIPEQIEAALPGAYVFRGSLLDQCAVSASGAPVLCGLRSDGWNPSLLDAYDYISGARHGPVLSSLGCPGACSYCASAQLQGPFIIRELDVVASEIERLHDRFKVEHFAFFDDALLHKPEKNVIPLLKEIIKRGLNVHFHTPNGLQVKQLSPHICDLMKQAGFSTLRFGYESGDARFARDTGAKASRGELAAKFSMLKESGFWGKDIGVYVMAGFPGQSPADVVAEIQFVASLSVMVKPVFLSPVPRTKLFETYRKTFPDLTRDPLLQNDSFFISRLPGWDADAVQHIVDVAKQNNARLDTARE
jgi:radical SAM superfamily enzyme YgiQ (UPF0313 family)